jgi:uncharacterized protein YqeY
LSLKEKINEDLNAAMKEKNPVRVETLRSIRAEILKMDKSGMNREMTGDEELQLLMRQAKQRKESIEMFQQASRADLVEKEKAQLEIINEYLPKPMTEEEAGVIIEKIIKETGAASEQDIGKIMGAAMKELKGKIDGKIIQEIARKKLTPPK